MAREAACLHTPATPYGRRTVLDNDFTEHSDPHAGGHAFAIGHQGLYHDGEVSAGLIYNRARMLHPWLGRFVQRDPVKKYEPGGAYQDGLNLYQCLRSNPSAWLDPTGGRNIGRPAQLPGCIHDRGPAQ